MSEFRVTNINAPRRVVDPVVLRVAQGVLRDVVAATPHGRTGNLRRGWRLVRARDAKWRVVNDVPYARHVEYGTIHRPAAAMLGRTIASWRMRYPARWDR